MGDVVAFRPQAVRQEQIRAAADPKGQVLLFTGVRYERHDQTIERAPARAPRKRRNRA